MVFESVFMDIQRFKNLKKFLCGGVFVGMFMSTGAHRGQRHWLSQKVIVSLLVWMLGVEPSHPPKQYEFLTSEPPFQPFWDISKPLFALHLVLGTFASCLYLQNTVF